MGEDIQNLNIHGTVIVYLAHNWSNGLNIVILVNTLNLIIKLDYSILWTVSTWRPYCVLRGLRLLLSRFCEGQRYADRVNIKRYISVQGGGTTLTRNNVNPSIDK